MQNIFKICSLIFLIFINLNASSIKSEYLITDKNLTLQEVKGSNFKQFNIDKHFNLGFSNKTIWIKLSNLQTQDLYLLLNNPILEKIEIYSNDKNKSIGVLQYKRAKIYPYTKLDFNSSDIHLHVSNKVSTLQFSLLLLTQEKFLSLENSLHNAILLFLGMLTTLALLSFLIFLYTKDKALLFYILYLSALIYQQITYLGFLPAHMPLWFNIFDNNIAVWKVALLIISASLYARAFLRTKKFKKIDFFYKAFIVITLIEIPLVGTQNFYYPQIIILTGLLFIFFNTYSGIKIYLKGYKEARFFVAAWIFLLTGYLFMIVDALGVVSIMYHIPYLILILTVIEATLLLIAFIDKFYIYQQEKLSLEKEYSKLLLKQKEQIANEVKRQTKELQIAAKEKEMLFRELNHRVKNNLQLIVSLIDLQKSRTNLEETKEALSNFKNRIISIAKIHEGLLANSNKELIDMKLYTDALIQNIVTALSKEKITIKNSTKIFLPMKVAINIGLILNEFITNEIKYGDTKEISIKLTNSNNNYTLKLNIPYYESSSKGLGFLIIKTMVYSQLKGKIESVGKNTIIRFKL